MRRALFSLFVTLATASPVTDQVFAWFGWPWLVAPPSWPVVTTPAQRGGAPSS